MKIANCFLPRLLLTLAVAGIATAWIPQEKGKRKLRMAEAAPDLSRPVASQLA
jgi:hypothetical protein